MNGLLLHEEDIASHIYFIRGQKVMLDSDLAQIYGVETKVLNQAVKRNEKRFPKDFMFQLTEAEWNNLRSQFVTLNNNDLKSQNVTSGLRSQNATLKDNRGKHRKYLPY